MISAIIVFRLGPLVVKTFIDQQQCSVEAGIMNVLLYPSECNYWIAIKPPHSNMSPAAARPPPSGTQR